MLSGARKPCPCTDIIFYGFQRVLAGSGAAAGMPCESQAACGTETQRACFPPAWRGALATRFSSRMQMMSLRAGKTARQVNRWLPFAVAFTVLRWSMHATGAPRSSCSGRARHCAWTHGQPIPHSPEGMVLLCTGSWGIQFNV